MTRTTVSFQLRFPARGIAAWSARFPEDGSYAALERIGRSARVRGHLVRSEFLAICAWKSPRSRPRCRENSEHQVRTITAAVLAVSNETLRMDLLRLLRGVEWPTASTILHALEPDRYPILDYRALWSLGWAKPPASTMAFWLAYLEFTRALARRHRVSLRTLDRALWQYSKERQPARGKPPSSPT